MKHSAPNNDESAKSYGVKINQLCRSHGKIRG